MKKTSIKNDGVPLMRINTKSTVHLIFHFNS